MCWTVAAGQTKPPGSAGEADKFQISAAMAPPGNVIAVVVATTAVVPFVQAIATKAGENAYISIRAMVRWLWLHGRPKRDAPRVRRPEDRLRDLDVETVAADSRHREAPGIVIEWHEPSKSWRAVSR